MKCKKGNKTLTISENKSYSLLENKQQKRKKKVLFQLALRQEKYIFLPEQICMK
jgi:hypothetical protein